MRTYSRYAVGLVGGVFAACVVEAASFAYIGNVAETKVSVIDTATNTVAATVPLSESVTGFAVSPDGKRVYAANSYHTFVIDTKTNAVVASVTIGTAVGGYAGVAVNGTGTRVYVTSNWNQRPGVVKVIDTGINDVVATIPVGDTPVGVAVNPVGTRVYVTNMFSNDISVIDAATNAVIATIDLTLGSPCGRALIPFGVAVHPTGTRVYVANQNCMSSDGYWYTSVIDAATNAVVGHVASGTSPSPRGVAVSPDGTRVYVSNGAVIDAATLKMIATFPGGGLNGMALSLDGAHAYLPNLGYPSNGSVSVVDTSTYSVVATVNVGGNAMAFGQFVGPSIALPPPVNFAPITMRFTASRFPLSNSLPAPDDPVTGTIVWDAPTTNADVNTVTAISLTIDGHTYTVSEIGYMTSWGDGIIGGLRNEPNGIALGSDDFWISWNKSTLQPETFAYASASRDGIWQTAHFDSFSIEQTASGGGNYQGLWWKAPSNSESGWGINLAHQGDVIFATWYTYDTTGRAWWLSMTATKSSEAAYTGTLYQTTGPGLNADPFNPNLVARTAVGTGALTFSDASNGNFAYTVNGVSQSKAITRQAFDTLPNCVWGAQPDLTRATNYQDLWWAAPAGIESGWGVNFTHQGDTIFATWFTYDVDGSPLWLSATTSKTTPATYAGTLYRTTGPAFNAVPFDPNAVTRTAVGTLTLTFTDGNAASYAYRVALPGSLVVIQTKSITRQVFRAPGTICR